jgi:hypothetical protein
MPAKEKIDSKTVVRNCEKCKNASLLLTHEVKGTTSINVVVKLDAGVVAERWSCQNCDHYFEATMEKPKPSSVWLFFGLFMSIVGLIATSISSFQFLTDNIIEATNFTFITGSSSLIIGILLTYIGYRKATLFNRNFIVAEKTPPPMHERKENLPLERRPRKCTCEATLINEGDVKHSFNMLPTGVIYNFKCKLDVEPNSSLDISCNKTVVLESNWRTILFLITAFLLLLIAKLAYENGIKTLLGWAFFVILLLIALAIFAKRSLRIYLKLKHPRLSNAM